MRFKVCCYQKVLLKYFYMIMLDDGKHLLGKYSRPGVLNFSHILQLLGKLLKSLNLTMRLYHIPIK